MTYVPPGLQKKAFTCPSCLVLAQMYWNSLVTRDFFEKVHETGFDMAQCAHCSARTIWRQHNALESAAARSSGSLVWPSVLEGPPPHDDMPSDVKSDYEEARSICAQSPRGAAALLRLCVDKLARSLLGDRAKSDINSNISLLVHDGLPAPIQQALDIVRVVGNNAVHPGRISRDDIASVATQLFVLVNAIVADRITRPRELASLYAMIPAGALSGIQDRYKPRRSPPEQD